MANINKDFVRDFLDSSPEIRKYINEDNWKEFWKAASNYKAETYIETSINIVSELLLTFGELNINCHTTDIPSYSFYKRDLGNVVLPPCIRNINNDSFRYANITSISLPDILKVISSQSFNGSSLPSINIPSSVKNIDERAFTDCYNLSKVTLHEGLEEINFAAFWGCALDEIIIPDSVERLGLNCLANINKGKPYIINLPAKWKRRWARVEQAVINGDRSEYNIEKTKNQWKYIPKPESDAKNYGEATIIFY